MAVKTELKVRTTDPVTGKSKTQTSTYANPNATDAELNDYAQMLYGGLSANTVDEVERITRKVITNET